MKNLLIGLLALVLLVLTVGCGSQSPLAPDFQDESVTETTNLSNANETFQEEMTKRDKDRPPMKTTN